MAEAQDSIWLNGVKYPIVDAVLWDRVTPYPDQVTQQAPDETDFKPLTKQRWNDFIAGAGVEKWAEKDNGRFSDSEGLETSQRIRTPGPAVSTLGSFGAAPVRLIIHLGKVWAIGHQAISSWNGSSWDSHKTDLDNPTDAILYYGNIA